MFFRTSAQGTTISYFAREAPLGTMRRLAHGHVLSLTPRLFKWFIAGDWGRRSTLVHLGIDHGGRLAIWFTRPADR